MDIKEKIRSDHLESIQNKQKKNLEKEFPEFFSDEIKILL